MGSLEAAKKAECTTSTVWRWGGWGESWLWTPDSHSLAVSVNGAQDLAEPRGDNSTYPSLRVR